MQDIIASMVSLFLIEPLQAEMADKLAAARAPQALVAELTACVRDAAPVIVDRANSDPWWAVTSGFQVWIGTARPETLLADAAPSCDGAIRAARPFLTGDEA